MVGEHDGGCNAYRIRNGNEKRSEVFGPENAGRVMSVEWWILGTRDTDFPRTELPALWKDRTCNDLDTHSYPSFHTISHPIVPPHLPHTPSPTSTSKTPLRQISLPTSSTHLHSRVLLPTLTVYYGDSKHLSPSHQKRSGRWESGLMILWSLDRLPRWCMGFSMRSTGASGGWLALAGCTSF